MHLAYAAQYDTMNHWPNPISEVSCVECKEDTNTQCKKCEVPLCFNGKGNCFTNYYTSPKDKITYIPKFAPPHLSSDSESDLDHSKK